MIVSIDDRYALALHEPHDFKGFKVVVDHPSSARDAVAQALAGIGGMLLDDHAWVPSVWIRHQPRLADDAEWQRNLQGMLDYAARKGWIDAARGLVRAHLEWRPVQTTGA